MRKLLFGAMLACICAPAMAQVGVSVNVSQPGFYGQINIGSVPAPPQVIYAQPVVIQPAPTYVGGPIYLRVPPGHEKHWAKHCAEYNACGRPVYFVREDWYNREYVPRQHHDDGHGENKDHGHGHGHDHDD
jgi:hypothetical protein